MADETSAGMAMRNLLTKRGDAALAGMLRRRPLLAFDFDGTLAPIVARPEQARVPGALATHLAWLAARVPVAIVSGRAVGDVRQRLGFVPRYIVGNHGAEEEVPLAVNAADAAALSRALDPVRQRVAACAAALAAAGVELEDKGLSLALHYRRARDTDAALALIGQLLTPLPEALHVFGGKMVQNVVARHAPDKADAVRRLQSHSGADSLFYAGDDVNDEPVFSAASPHWLTVRVGRDGGASRARYFLAGVNEMGTLLERMVAHLHASHPQA
jgi:trehalose 6-phosphate phosphatase